MKVDIFCDVIDFWGDVAVSWRLAQALISGNPHWQITYYCNDWSAWKQITGYNSLNDYIGPLVLCDFFQQNYTPSDVAIEMLACSLPAGYPCPPLRVNVEYFTAEDWSISCHMMQSYPLKRFFFIPGVHTNTGGLVWGNFSYSHAIDYDRVHARRLWMSSHHIDLNPHTIWVSAYLYDLDYTQLCISDQVRVVGPKIPGMRIDKISDFCIFVECTQAEYDALMSLCDMHLVRGEDSLSRALLTGQPFLWQAYVQEDAAHIPKIQALVRSLAEEGCEEYTILKYRFDQLNEYKIVDLDAWIAEIPLVQKNFKALQAQIIQLGSQEENLRRLICEKMGKS
ncbi:MAG: elongation factor P maturation arginine rhamnosyltransferase EarP [Spirochaetia bacterium]